MKKQMAVVMALIALAGFSLGVAGAAPSGANGAGDARAAPSDAQAAPSDAKARKILKKTRPLAEQGNANAQYNMGVLYDDGYGVKRNYDTAMQWYKKAAAQHYPKAEHNLGIMYAAGHGVGKSMKKAAHWFKRAAEDGEPASQNNLAVMYARGEGVAQNTAKAALWAARAARAGNQSAVSNVPQIIARMTHARISGDNVNIRAFPGKNARVKRHANSGTGVVVLDRQAKWSRVLFPGDYAIGWVANSLLAKSAKSGGSAAGAGTGKAGGAAVQTTAAGGSQSAGSTSGASSRASASPKKTKTGQQNHQAKQKPTKQTTRHIAGDVVNVRAKPNTHANILFQARQGRQATVLKHKNGWSHVRFNNGRSGWVASYLLKP